MKKLILLFVLILGPSLQISFAQNAQIDSIYKLIHNSKPDTTRLNLFMALADACETKDNLTYGNQAMEFADKLLETTADTALTRVLIKKKVQIFDYYITFYNENKNSQKVIDICRKKLACCTAIKLWGSAIGTVLTIKYHYTVLNEYYKAFEICKVWLEISEKHKYKIGVARISEAIADQYSNLGYYEQSIESFKKSLRIWQESNNLDAQAKILVRLGTTYGDSKNLALADKYILQGEKIYEKLNDNQGIIWAYNCLGISYDANDKSNEAIQAYQKGIQISESSKNGYWLAVLTGNVGHVYERTGNYEKALEYALKTLKIGLDSNYTDRVGFAKYLIGKIHFRTKNYSKAKQSIQELVLINSNGIQTFQLAAQIDSALGNYKDAFIYYQKYIANKNLVFNEEVKREAIADKFKTEYEKRKEIDRINQVQKDAMKESELKRQKTIRNSIVVGLILMMCLSLFIFYHLVQNQKKNRIISAQKHLVEEKNQQITDSIEYALRIQSAILPPSRVLKANLLNSFVLYMPKDIVAGDFYWMEPQDKLVLFAACDCTGHGVPGAMVSVMCHNALNRSVREFGLTKPSEILDKVSELVIENFQESDQEIKDGMDASLCAFYPSENKLQWAGANNPLWIIRKAELIEIKGDKQPIGQYEYKQPFTNHEIALEKGDSIYILSDGYADQFGGENGSKKLTRKALKNLLVSMQEIPMTEQGDKLKEYLTQYRGAVSQIDDILIMGVKV